MDELEVISRVETRLVLASTDEKFSAALDLYLCPLLLKLSSNREDSRKKVLSIVEHVNARLSPQVALPLGKLLDLAISTGPEGLLTKTVAANYLRKGFDSQSVLPWVARIGKHVEAVAGESPHRASLLFQLVLKGLIEWHSLKDAPVVDFEDAAPGLSKRFADLFLVDLAFRTRQVAPSLNHDDFVFQLGPSSDLSESTLSASKMAVLHYLDAADWPVDLKYLPLFVASADRLSDVSSNATSQLRHLSVSLDANLASKLEALALGSNGALPGKNALQIKVLDCFSRDPVMAPVDPSPLLQRAFESGDQALLDTAIKFVRALAVNYRQAPSSPLSTNLVRHANTWIEHIRSYITNSGWPCGHISTPQASALRQRAYETLGVLHRLAGISSLSVLRFLFESMERDITLNAPSIQEALGEVLSGISSLPQDLRPELKSVLKGILSGAERDATKYMAVRYAMLSFSFSDAEARVLCLLGLDPRNRSDVQEEARRGLHPYLYEKSVATYLESVEVQVPEFEELLNTVEAANLSDFAPPVFDKALLLLSQVLINQAHPVRVDSEWTKVVDAAPLYDANARQAVGELLVRLPAAPKLFDYCRHALASDLEVYHSAPKIWGMLVKVSPASLLETQVANLPDLLRLVDGRFGDVIAESIAKICPLSSATELAQELVPLTPGKSSALACLVERVSLNGMAVPGELVSELVDYCRKHKRLTPLFHLARGGLLAHSDDLLQFLKSIGDEKAMLVIGAMRLSNPDHAEQYMKVLLSLNSSQNIDTLLANGEALSVCVSGWQSTSLEKHPLATPEDDQSLVAVLIEEIFAGSKKTDPAVRRSSCVSLLCVVQFNSEQAKGYFGEIQTCFLRFLSDSDDICQEAASRGLGIVYEQSDEAVKAELVEKLVSSFTNDQASRRAMAGTISDDTQLFEPGMLSTGDGSISTYKDVLNLASEVGDSTLVYKFMSLAASSKIWSSRRGVAFGLETIMARADFDNSGSARKKLIPKLFRYIFDPNTKARDAMQSIWNVLVPDRRKAVLENLDAIVKELLEGSHAREWRVREASTRGLCNLVETLEWRHLEGIAVDLWQMALRLLDDIKESVRKAGLDFTKALASVLTRRLQAHSESNSTLLSTLIPFLSGPRGLQSESEDVRVFAMDTLIKIAKSDSKDFKPFKLKFINDFTLLLSTIEPQAMNYLALNAANYGVTANTVDESRMRGLSRSPIMETLETLVDRLDPEELRLYMSELPRSIKGSVGLPSKLASARLVISVCLRFPRDTDPTPILNACATQFKDRNDLVAQTFAAAAGYVCRLTALPEVLRYLEMLKKSYFSEEGDERQRLIAAVAVSNLSKHASDVFGHVAATALPWVFVGSFDSDKDVAKLFKDVWNSNTGGEGSIQLYATEILELAAPHLQSAVWHMREAAAKSIGSTAKYVKTANEPLLKQLLDAMGGRTWPGKEFVFQALVKVALAGTSDIAAVNSRVITESKRKSIEYRAKVLPFVGEFLEKFPDGEVYEAFFGALVPIFEAADDNDEKATEDQQLEVLASAVQSYNPGFEIEPNLDELLLKVLTSWKFKIAVSQHMAKLAGKNYFSHAVWQRTTQVCPSDYGHEAVRLEWVKAAGALRDFGISDEVRRLTRNEPSSVVITELKKYNFA